MNFLISDSFTDSLAKLTAAEQKAVKTTAFDLQIDPTGKGKSFHKLANAKDPKFWSVRVSSDIRLIVHRSDQSLLLCYVDHHDKAYAWAERRKLQTHPATGAAQIVEIRERVQEVVVPALAPAEPATAEPSASTPASSKPVLEHVSATELLAYGVPEEWVADARAATEDSIFALIEHLPAEAGEALLDLATGGKPQPAPAQRADIDPFEHPDAKRRFRSLADQEALEQAFAYPWEKWITFLHPSQRQVVERSYSGPVRISGSAGTGKSIVALHRAVWLAREDEQARVLLTTFSDALANALHDRMARLIVSTPHLADRIEVASLPSIAERLSKRFGGPAAIADDQLISTWLDAIMADNPTPFRKSFYLSEWRDIVDGWQIADWESYRSVKRLGRKTRLSEGQREQAWTVLSALRQKLDDTGHTTHAARYRALATHFSDTPNRPFDAVVVDECQDLTVTQMQFLAALGGTTGQGLFFCGDLGQRIFQLPFSWKSLGIDIRGRGQTLRINYRTSHQIRQRADRLLDPELTDLDGNTEGRRGAQSVFNGPAPQISIADSEGDEIQAVSDWITARLQENQVEPREIGIFVRSNEQIDRATQAAERAGLPFIILDRRLSLTAGKASIGTMHLAKGLEFRAVVVMACDDEVLPLQSRIDEIGDDADLEETYRTERHLFYVACTRARDHLCITSVDPASEFLEDLRQ